MRVPFERPSLPRVYLAGKVSKSDWRHDVVPGLRGALDEHDVQAAPFPMRSLTISDQAVYTGPFFVSDDHGCAHGPGTHGNGQESCLANFITDGKSSRLAVAQRCREGIADSTAVFVWLDDVTAYGTLVEIGLAAAMEVPVWIYSPESFDATEMWFASHIASDGRILHAASPAAAVTDLLMKLRMRAKPL